MHGPAGLFIGLPDPAHILYHVHGLQPVLMDRCGVSDEADEGGLGSLGKMELKSFVLKLLLQDLYFLRIGISF